ncbi:MAG TPA: Fur family transcriptional regulator [Armatimonadota bacterium]|nr:Fur family transcriptional regulator [Armatimonadota bacterium]
MDTLGLLRSHGIQPTPQRMAVAGFAIDSRNHPSAEEVYLGVREACPTVSRATVYNTLHLLVERGLVRQLALREGVCVYDSQTAPHHHFIDDDTGRIEDVPWDAVSVTGTDTLQGIDVREFQVVMRGRRRPR